MPAAGVSNERLVELLSDSRVMKAASRMRALIDEKRAPLGRWTKDNGFQLVQGCSQCGNRKHRGAIIHGKEPFHIASVEGVPEKWREVDELAKVLKKHPEFKNPNVVRSWLAAEAASEAIAEIPVRPAP